MAHLDMCELQVGFGKLSAPSKRRFSYQVGLQIVIAVLRAKSGDREIVRYSVIQTTVT